MAAGAAEVGTLRVRSAAGDTPAVRLAASAWLGGAELHPRDLPPSAVLIVRRMADPLPGKLPAGGPAPPDPAWERAARSSLDDFCRRAARPARGPVPPGAEAVLFIDEAEMLACLALDLARGSAFGRWWWSLVLRRLGAQDLPRLLAAEPTRVPALLHHLAQWHRAAEICESLSEPEALTILSTVARSHGATALAQIVTSTPPGTAGVPPAGGREGTEAPEPAEAEAKPPKQPAWSPQPAWQRRLRAIPGITRLAPAQRVLLAAGLALFEEPGRARSVAFAAEVREWWVGGALMGIEERKDEETEEREGRDRDDGGLRGPSPPDPLSHPHSLPPGEGAPPPSVMQPRWEVESEAGTRSPDLQIDPRRPLPEVRDARTMDRSETGAGSVAMPDGEAEPSSSPGRVAASSLSEARREAEPATIETEEPRLKDAIQVEVEAAGLVFDEGVATEIAGLFYLINVMTALDIPAAFEEVGAWAVLEAFARDLLGPLMEDLATDPVWKVLALLDGHDPDEFPPLPEEGRGWERGLAQTLGLDPEHPENLPPLLLLRPGRIHVTTTHVDIVMDLESISLPVRLAGLDRDPGWVPAFGRVIQFHFQ